MARDIEEFLRRAAERRKQKQNQQRGGATSQRVRDVVESAEVEVVQPSRPVKPKRRLPSQVVSKPKKRDLRNESVAEHVRSHIDSTDIAEHADHLGEGIQQADDRIAARLKRKFEHDVSKIDDLPTVQDDEVATVTKRESSQIALDIIEMFRTPKSVRQAILISEILKRPDFE